jgi:DNA polymerase III delta' subunit
MSPAPRQWLTRAQPATIAAAAALVRGALPHAVLISGPPSVGKTTLAEDIATGLLCLAANPADRPCRKCRGCRLVAGGNHPDLHRLGPEGPGGQIVIGESGRASPRGVRNLVAELAYLPVEGGHRVALVEHADRMNEDAQNALLKTLEEPPAGVSLILCADEPDRLLPTVRSRCVQVRVAPLGSRAIEELLADLQLADAPAAARFARIAGGRPGLAIAYARSPEAVTIHDEIGRTLLDLLAAPSAVRLTTGRELIERAGALEAALRPVAPPDPASGPGRGRGRSAAARRTQAAPEGGEPGGVDDGAEPAADTAGPAKRPPAERRRAALALVGLWRELAMDLAIAGLGGRAEVRDPALLDELIGAAAGLAPADVGRFLARLDRLAELVEGNAGPELAIDVLVLAWPRARARAA